MTKAVVAASESNRLATGVALAVGIIFVAVVIGGFYLSRALTRLGDVEATQVSVLQIVKDVKGIVDGQAALLVLVQKQQEEEARAGKIRKDQLDRLTELAAGLKVISERTEAVSRQVPECFQPPNGDCVKASAKALSEIKAATQDLLTRTKFIATELPGQGAGKTFELTPKVSPSCLPPIQIGDVGVGQGVICRGP